MLFKKKYQESNNVDLKPNPATSDWQEILYLKCTYQSQ